jgi:hypothetical protein
MCDYYFLECVLKFYFYWLVYPIMTVIQKILPPDPLSVEAENFRRHHRNYKRWKKLTWALSAKYSSEKEIGRSCRRRSRSYYCCAT